MIKKFLASLAVLALFATSTASAFIDAGAPPALLVLDDGELSDLTVSPEVFDPSKGQSAKAVFTVNEATVLYAYVIPKNDPSIEYVFYDDIYTTAGTKSIKWYGTEGNVYGGTPVADGVYTIKVYALSQGGLVLDWEFADVEVDSNPFVNPPVNLAPDITGLGVSPSSFDPKNGEVVNIDFNVDATADIWVDVRDGTNVLRTFSNYDGDKHSAGGNYMEWDGRDNSGNVVADGVYTVYILAKNSYGGDKAYSTVTVDTNNPPAGDAPEISNVTVSPSTFDPYDEDTTIRFYVDERADLTVEIRDGSRVVREFSNYDRDEYAAGTNTLNWDGEDNYGDIVDDGTYTVYIYASNDDGSDSYTRSVVVDTDGNGGGDIITDFELDPSNDWDPTEEDLEISFELTEDVDDLRITAEKGYEEIELLDDRNVDEDYYVEDWDGEDEDGDLVDEGRWAIVIEADGERAVRYIDVEYDTPEIIDAFVTKSPFDPENDEFTYVVFRVDTDAVATVELYDGSRRELTLMDEDGVEEDKWYAVKWDGKDDDGDEMDEDTYQFRITAADEDDDDIYDRVSLNVTVKEDDTSSRIANATEDYMDPVIFDENEDNSIDFHYCIDDDTEVYLAIYKGAYTSGSEVIELLDYDDEDEGCHTVSWDAEDDDGDDLRDGIYSYKLITRESGSYKDTETGKFVVGELGEVNRRRGGGDDSDCDSGRYNDIRNVSQEYCEAITWATDEGIFSGYSDGSFRPYNYINRAEVLKVTFEAFDGQVTILPSNGSNLGFRDVDPNAWYMPYARTAKFYGMLHGYLNQTEARLNNTINRAEFLKFVLEASDAFTPYEVPGFESAYYADVLASEPTHDWFFDYAGVSRTLGLFNDFYDASTGRPMLEPGRLVQRAEVALVLYRMNKAGLLD